MALWTEVFLALVCFYSSNRCTSVLVHPKVSVSCESVCGEGGFINRVSRSEVRSIYYVRVQHSGVFSFCFFSTA